MSLDGPASGDPTALFLLIAAGGLLAVSGAPGLLLHWRSRWGPRIAVVLVALASLIGLAGAALFLLGPGGPSTPSAGPAMAGTWTDALYLAIPAPLDGLDTRLRLDALWDPLESTCRHASLSIL